MQMNTELIDLLRRLDDPFISKAEVIHWGSPIISFGDHATSRIATLGLNPSNREFVDINGNELVGHSRRFHSLNSLGISRWADATEEHLSLLFKQCREYFYGNPYNAWFKRLDNLISGTTMSYYFPFSKACHLDLIPYATFKKWGDLTIEQQSLLLDSSSDLLGHLLNNSTIDVVVLNGESVVRNLDKVSDLEFERTFMADWALPRKHHRDVPGYAYTGRIRKLGNVSLNRDIRIIGYNHNIQSSYGVTTQVQMALRNWITKKVQEVIE